MTHENARNLGDPHDDDFGDSAPDMLRKLHAEEQRPGKLIEPPSDSALLSVRWSYSLGCWIWNRNF